MSGDFDFRSVGPVEDVAEPVRAWRGWTVRRHQGRGTWHLASLTMTTRGIPMLGGASLFWPTGGIVARCYCREARRGEAGKPLHALCPGPPPEAAERGLNPHGNGCGVYGMKTPGDLMGSEWARWAHVLGEVELGGRLWEHGKGWRAQYARVVRLGPLRDVTREALRENFLDPRRVEQEIIERYGLNRKEVADGRDR